MVYQNPDDPFGKKEVFVPPPRKVGSVAAMAKMFASNVGLEDQAPVESVRNNSLTGMTGIVNTVRMRGISHSAHTSVVQRRSSLPCCTVRYYLYAWLCSVMLRIPRVL